MVLVENFIGCLRHIRENKGQASGRTIMDHFNASMENANELIEYLYEEGYIHEPLRMADGNRIRLRLTSEGLNIITNLK